MKLFVCVLISIVLFMQIFRSVDQEHLSGIEGSPSHGIASSRPAASCSDPAAQPPTRPQRSLLQRAAGTVWESAPPFKPPTGSADVPHLAHKVAAPPVHHDSGVHTTNASFEELPFTSFVGVGSDDLTATVDASTGSEAASQKITNCWPGAHALLGDTKVLREARICMAQRLKNAARGEVATDILIVILACAGVVVVLFLAGLAGAQKKNSHDAEEASFLQSNRNVRGGASAGSGYGRSSAGYVDRVPSIPRQNSRTGSRSPCAPAWGNRQQPPPSNRQLPPSQTYQPSQVMPPEDTNARNLAPTNSFRENPSIRQQPSPGPPAPASQSIQGAPQYQQAPPPSNMSVARQPSTPPALSALPPASSVIEEPPRTISNSSLCPGLLVPRGNECVVAVPIVNVHGPQQSLPFSIKEMSGQPVINVETIPAVWGNAGERKIITLRAAQPPSPLIAYCKAADSGAGRRSVYIYDAHDELFGHITKVMALGGTKMSRYVFTSARVGLQLQFEGNFREHAVQIQSGDRKVLADTEPYQVTFDKAGQYYRLRVTENNDVGLLLCALLSIEHMEAP